MGKYLLFVFLAFSLATILAPDAFAIADGATLLETRCSVCHSPERAKSKQKTPEQWDATVSRMMAKGARLTQEEKKVLLDYLSKTYKP